MEGPFDIGPKAEGAERKARSATGPRGIHTCCAFSFVALVTDINCEASFRCVVVDGIVY